MTVAVQLGHETVITLLMDNDRTYHRVRLPALHVAAKRDDVRAATILLQRDPSRTKVILIQFLHCPAHFIAWLLAVQVWQLTLLPVSPYLSVALGRCAVLQMCVCVRLRMQCNHFLYTKYLQKLRTGFHEISCRGRAWPREESVWFWWRSGIPVWFISWILDYFPGFIAIIRQGINWTDFDYFL